MNDFDRTPEEREAARREREARRRGEKPPKATDSGPKLPKLGKVKQQNPKPEPPPAQAPGEKPLPAVRRPAVPRGEKGPGGPRVDLDRIRRATAKRREGAAAVADEKPPRPPRGRAFRVFMGILGIGAVVLVYLLVSIFQPFKGDGEGSVRVAIPTGAGVGEIADVLEERGVIGSATFFEARVTLAGRRGDLKPGNYELARDMSFGTVIDRLADGPPDDVVSLTVPEGRSRREVSALVRQAGIEGGYTAATRRSRALNPARYGAGRARDLEGFLYPATYELEKGDGVRVLVSKQLQAFKREFRKVSLTRAKRRNLTAYDVLIIASMVEREAMLDKERPVIASVIYNRLRRGEPLGIDATIRFATNNWEKPLTQSELAIDSPYNTRNRAGLPPGPIGSPGLESIRAAANPADTDFLFYVVKPGTCGEHDFSKTLEEFERDAARYNRERDRRGGRSPTDCP
ncbi:MAG TPA: endolytic transglycosylase MltG [Thermoleophilaceae bacterium]|nr:endolytic transglycosylase MltG [Thermoleophilaceae bacterium]